MRKIYLAFLAFAFPIAAMAQPTITSAEDYSVSESLHFTNTSVPDAGLSGHQTWDFSSAPDSGGFVLTVQTDSNGGLIANNYISNTINSGQTLLLVNGVSALTPGALFAKRPMTYNDNGNNTYLDSLSTFVYGGGTSELLVDGWGTIITPAATYTENAIRVRVAIHQEDSGIITHTTTDRVIYSWYVNSHHAPVFQIDSTTNTLTGTTVNTTYLTADFPADVKSLNNTVNNASVNFADNNMTIKAALAQGKEYNVSVYNVAGQRVYNNAFTATGTVEHFNLNKQITPGTYLVSIFQKNGSAPIIIKGVK